MDKDQKIRIKVLIEFNGTEAVKWYLLREEMKRIENNSIKVTKFGNGYIDILISAREVSNQPYDAVGKSHPW